MYQATARSDNPCYCTVSSNIIRQCSYESYITQNSIVTYSSFIIQNQLCLNKIEVEPAATATMAVPPKLANHVSEFKATHYEATKHLLPADE